MQQKERIVHIFHKEKMLHSVQECCRDCIACCEEEELYGKGAGYQLL